MQQIINGEIMINFQKPNLPEEGTVLICDKAVPLSNNFKNFIASKSLSVLPSSMRCHTDLQICYIKSGIFLCAPEVYEYYCEKLSPFGAEVLCGDRIVGDTYGDDCAYNILVMGEYAFHNTKFTPEKAKKLFEREKIKLVHVNQGYTKCAVAPVSEKALITADASIKKAAEALGFDCLEIEWGGVNLPGFEHGFFGGCSGRISKNEFYVCGSLKNHPSRDKIIEFLAKYNLNLIESGENMPLDVGSLIIA